MFAKGKTNLQEASESMKYTLIQLVIFNVNFIIKMMRSKSTMCELFAILVIDCIFLSLKKKAQANSQRIYVQKIWKTSGGNGA